MPNPAETSLRKPRYKQCLKNHAVGIGSHAVVGCTDFMATGVDGSLDALKCAACNCHRKETKGAVGFSFHHHQNQQQQLLLTHHPHGHFSYISPSGYLHVAHPRQQRPTLALLSTLDGGARSGSRDELENYYSNTSSSAGKKRFRYETMNGHLGKKIGTLFYISRLIGPDQNSGEKGSNSRSERNEDHLVWDHSLTKHCSVQLQIITAARKAKALSRLSSCRQILV
ncbi:Hypothetical predicted protein [Olea europaea subsp. europaea]|uniref:ZF-HD dimerization-type domain-containing protein n=1 Tax=Olea europaea subsp. europaea TaxID=158383 RepID=A0A8S0SR95_OLEEU|nr:Hypothetical predicted protein [Olea europaea subsp. europaea]